MNIKKSPSLKASEINRKWYVIDASQAPLGRISTQVASLLIGKGKSTFSPNMDNGDYVVVINSDALITTGRKEDQKRYYRHSGYIGSIKEATLSEMMEKDSTQVITLAVKGMLPKNKLQADRLARLKVFPTAEHTHEAQKPQKVEVK